MRLAIVDNTARAAEVLEQLEAIPLKESGVPFHRDARLCETQEQLREILHAGPVFIVDEERMAEAVLRARPASGVLVLSASARLGRGSTLRGLLEDRTITGRRLACFGLRRWSPEELEIARRHDVHVFSMLEISREGLSELTDAVMALARSWSSFHLIVCLDVLDPAFAPGGVPGGMTPRELIYIVQRLRLIAGLQSAEIVLDADAAPLGAHLIAELL